MSTDAAHFSSRWLVASIVIFVLMELALGGVVGSLLVGKYVSEMWHLKMQLMLNLGAYFVGGVVVGMLSPGVRIVEPALGAFVSVALVLAISWFLPYSFLQLSFGKLLLGGGIAFALALTGAKLGERVMGNRV